MKNDTPDALNDLIQFNADWDKAMIENDVQKIGRFMADNWIIIATEGGITSKSSFLEFIKPAGLFHNRMDFEIIKADIYGDTGVVVAKGISAGTFKGELFSYSEWSTSIFHKERNGWLCVLTMLTPAITADA